MNSSHSWFRRLSTDFIDPISIADAAIPIKQNLHLQLLLIGIYS